MSLAKTHLFAIVCLLSISSAFLVAKNSVRDLPPRYRTWVTDEVNYIITKEERNVLLALPTDEDRDKFIEHFWELRNPTPGAPTNVYKEEIYRRIAYAKQYLDGVHSAMGQTYITLGEPNQRGKYRARSEVRPMEIWFYQNTSPALPPYFSVLFFDRDNTGDMRFYSPYMDGPAALATSVLTVNDNKHSFQAIDKALGREVARTTLSLLPDEPVDMQNAKASLQSDVMLSILKNLANHPLTKAELEQKRLAERVTHRMVLNDEFLDVITIPLRDAAGNFNLHYLLRLHRPADFSIEEANNKVFYNVAFAARVYDPDKKLIFKQEKDVSQYLDAAEVERIKHSLFGYEGWLPLVPGKYKIDFLLTNKLSKTAYRAEREVVIPALPAKGVQVSDVLAFSDVKSVGPGKDYLPFTVGGVKFTPAAGEGLTYSPGQDLNIFYQLWGRSGEPVAYNGKNVVVDYAYGRLGSTGDAKSVHEEVAKQQFDSFGSMLTGKKIALAAEAGAGNYRLVVSVNDPDSSQKVYSSLNFRIYGVPGAPPPFYVYDSLLVDEIRQRISEFDRALC